MRKLKNNNIISLSTIKNYEKQLNAIKNLKNIIKKHGNH